MPILSCSSARALTRHPLKPYYKIKQDDGGTEHGGVDRSERRAYEIEVHPSRALPTFSIPSVFATRESSGVQEVMRFVEGISAGPSIEMFAVLDDSFVIDYDPKWFSQAPTVSRQGTLQFELAPHAFGFTYVQLSLTARQPGLNVSRSNVQQFLLGTFPTRELDTRDVD